MNQLKKQLQSRKKQVQKAQKSAKIEQLCSQIAETDVQLACLWQQSKFSKSNDKNVTHPTASSTLVSSGNSQHQWLQQAELDVANAFLDQLARTQPLQHHRLRSSPNLLVRGSTTNLGSSSLSRKDNVWTCPKHLQTIPLMSLQVSHRVPLPKILILIQDIPRSTSDLRSVNLSQACLPNMPHPLKNRS